MSKIICCKRKVSDEYETELTGNGTVVEYELKHPTEAKYIIPILASHLKFDCMYIKNADMLIGRETLIKTARKHEKTLVMTGITHPKADINMKKIRKREKCVEKRKGENEK